jgi:hypothetical protein
VEGLGGEKKGGMSCFEVIIGGRKKKKDNLVNVFFPCIWLEWW